MLDRVRKGLLALCCAAWGPPSVLMVLDLTYLLQSMGLRQVIIW